MDVTYENPGAMAVAAGAGAIKAQLAELVRIRAANQATLCAVFGIAANDCAAQVDPNDGEVRHDR